MATYVVPDDVDDVLRDIAARHATDPGSVLSASVSVLSSIESVASPRGQALVSLDLGDILPPPAGPGLRVVHESFGYAEVGTSGLYRSVEVMIC